MLIRLSVNPKPSQSVNPKPSGRINNLVDEYRRGLLLLVSLTHRRISYGTPPRNYYMITTMYCMVTMSLCEYCYVSLRTTMYYYNVYYMVTVYEFVT